MIEGSGAGYESGSIPLTNGSGSGRPKNMWIQGGSGSVTLLVCAGPWCRPLTPVRSAGNWEQRVGKARICLLLNPASGVSKTGSDVLLCRTLVSPSNPGQISGACQVACRTSGVLQRLEDILLASGIPADVLTETINTLGRGGTHQLWACHKASM